MKLPISPRVSRFVKNLSIEHTAFHTSSAITELFIISYKKQHSVTLTLVTIFGYEGNIFDQLSYFVFVNHFYS